MQGSPELCWDWYTGDYIAGLLSDDRGRASGSERVLRGGNRVSSAFECAVANRGGFDPNGQLSGIGFRVVRP